MSFKAAIKEKVLTANNVRRLAGVSYSLYQIRSAIGLKTRGSSSFRFLAFNKILKKSLSSVLTINIVGGEDFSEPELIKFQKWALKHPENHISLFIHPYKRACKIIVGEKYGGKIDHKEMGGQLEKVNALFQDKQFIKGVHEWARYIEGKLTSDLPKNK